MIAMTRSRGTFQPTRSDAPAASRFSIRIQPSLYVAMSPGPRRPMEPSGPPVRLGKFIAR